MSIRNVVCWDRQGEIRNSWIVTLVLAALLALFACIGTAGTAVADDGSGNVENATVEAAAMGFAHDARATGDVEDDFTGSTASVPAVAVSLIENAYDKPEDEDANKDDAHTSSDVVRAEGAVFDDTSQGLAAVAVDDLSGDAGQNTDGDPIDQASRDANDPGDDQSATQGDAAYLGRDADQELGAAVDSADQSQNQEGDAAGRYPDEQPAAQDEGASSDPADRPADEPAGQTADQASDEVDDAAVDQQTVQSTVDAAVALLASDATSSDDERMTGVGRFLAFASDLHGLADVLENAMKNFPLTTEYVSLIGDMVGSRGGDAPAFDSSSILERLQGIYGEDLTAEHASIIWADHDAGVNDDANIVECLGGHTSGPIYTAYNDDGTPDYYVYGIGFYDMTTGGQTSADAAAAFKSWVDGLDENAAVIVLCHVPLQAKRGDNFGATYWNEALNYAATGQSDISTIGTDAQVLRNVLYLYGHNHTVDQTEYVFQAGSTMNIQIDTTSGLLTSASDVDETIADDDELTAPVKAQGVTTDIYYTAFIPGYLKTSGNASLVNITSDTITLAKYLAGKLVDLGVDGTTGETVSGTKTITRVIWGEPGYVWSSDLSTVTAVRSSSTGVVVTETVQTSSEQTRAATCTSTGEIVYTATFSNIWFSTQQAIVETPALGHTPGEPAIENELPATCEEDGSYDTVVYCQTCGEELSRQTSVVPATGHDWGDWVVTVEPTQTEAGQEARTCRNDPSHVETRAIPPLGPDDEPDDGGSDDQEQPDAPDEPDAPDPSPNPAKPEGPSGASFAQTTDVPMIAATGDATDPGLLAMLVGSGLIVLAGSLLLIRRILKWRAVAA